ncbi:hypothetical protein AWC38_SpisGene11669 [Stylophora pistillata]|uniref:Uncharacterized protein n=1 Tax=Stylophora pistillata TaxID=50429 RepID=A0A2B4S2W4_STYPI|nr:hypothetical protein AWC38_SpisGene11669 [Stylophora pistillata]
MNPQFFSPLQVRPKLVPVVVQPTVPLASTSYALPPVNTFTSPVQHNNAFSTFCMSAADVVLDGKTTTARTRRELEHLGSTRRATELIFELAARKNGIRVGVDSSSRAASAGKLQDDSLEDFKKIAQQNGITVCPPGSISVEENGSKVRKDSDNACSQITEKNPTDNLANKHGEGMCLPTSHSIYPWESDSPSSAANFYELNNNHNDFKCSEEKGEIANEVPFEFRTTNTLDLFKIKAAASGIKVQHVTTMIEGQKPEFTQWGKQFSHHSETVLGMADLDTCVSGDTNSATSNVERVNDTESDATIMHYVNQNDEGYEDTRPEQEIFSEDSEKKSSIQKCGKEVPLSELRKEMDAANTCSEEGTDSDGRTNNSKEDQLDNEHVLSSSKEDAEIAAFQKIARQKGIKVGNSLPTTRLSTISCEVNAVESIEAHGSDVLEFTGDAQIAKFHEMARLNGIRVGGKMQESPLHSDGLKSFTTVSTKGNECWPRTPHPFGELCQIISVQDIGRVRDFKVTGEFSGSSSCSSLSTASSEDNLYYAGREGWRTTDRYEEVAKRNGIKIGKNCEASAQTEVHVETTDYCSQTCEEDLGFFKRNTGVQVDAVREAFEREFKQWKLDDNAAGDSEELCYKKLYLTERNAHEAIKDSLQNEKDVSANTKHNHKRVMEELKEELKSQGEEIEKLKKDLKTVKRQKETEAKRIAKDLKSKEDELESTKGALQLKEVALEGLRSIIKDKSEKLKTAEEQLEEMKTVLSKIRENREYSTW